MELLNISLFPSLNVVSWAPPHSPFLCSVFNVELKGSILSMGKDRWGNRGSTVQVWKPDYGWLKLRLGQIIQVLKESIVKVKLQKVMLANISFCNTTKFARTVLLSESELGQGLPRTHQTVVLEEAPL